MLLPVTPELVTGAGTVAMQQLVPGVCDPASLLPRLARPPHQSLPAAGHWRSLEVAGSLEVSCYHQLESDK